VLFRGNAEATIRRQLLKRGYVKGVIGLPANLFYGTGIPACILVLDKENAAGRTGVFMIDASKGFMKDGPKNRLRSQDIHRIVDVFNKQTEIDGYSRMVSLAEIDAPENDYNLNIPRFIDSSVPEDIQDLQAHLHGGIPERDIDALANYWNAFPSLRSELFKELRPGYVKLTVDEREVRQVILDSMEFQAFASSVRELVATWYQNHRPSLEGITADTMPAALIAELGDDLLERFKAVPLLDQYDVYEQLLSYWHESMHDDVFLVMNDGWARAAQPRKTIEDKERKLTEAADLIIGSGKNAAKYKMDLIPPSLLIARYFSEEQKQLSALDSKAAETALLVQEFVEENAVEEGLLAAALEDDKVTKALAVARLRDAKREGAEPEEIHALQNLVALYEDEAAAKKASKDAQALLDIAALEKYGHFSQLDVKQLALDDKWAATIVERIDSEVNSLTLALVDRIRELGSRYGQTASSLAGELALLEERLFKHLADMGVT